MKCIKQRNARFNEYIRFNKDRSKVTNLLKIDKTSQTFSSLLLTFLESENGEYN